MYLIDGYVAERGRLTVRANPAFGRKHLWGDFYVDYGEDIGLERMPPTVALAPFILNTAPLAWLSGKTWRVDALDAELAAALDVLRRRFRELYPRHRWDGALVADRLVDNTPAGGDAAEAPVAMLFSGGVDSVYTSLWHYPTPQVLFSVWGADTPLDATAKWRLLRHEHQRFAAEHGHRNLFVKSNAKQVVRRKRVPPEIPVWWAYVQHGMALPGLCIPALYRHGLREVCISSSEWHGGYDGPWGSSPELDESVRCAGIGVRHFGFEVTRQQKLGYIVDQVRGGLPVPRLAVCFRPYVEALNCGRCEKCRRTMAGLMVAGARPLEYGFAVDEAAVISALRRLYRTGRLRVDRQLCASWTAIQDAARAALDRGSLADSAEEVRDFVAWLGGLDFPGYMARYEGRPHWQERAKWLLSAHPGLYERVKQILERRAWLGY